MIASRRWRSCASQRRASGVPVAATASAGARRTRGPRPTAGAPARSTGAQGRRGVERPRQAAVSPRSGTSRATVASTVSAGSPASPSASSARCTAARSTSSHGASPSSAALSSAATGSGSASASAQLVADARPRDGGQRPVRDGLAGQRAGVRLHLEAQPGAVAGEAPQARGVVDEGPVVQDAQQPRAQVLLRARRLAQPPVRQVQRDRVHREVAAPRGPPRARPGAPRAALRATGSARRASSRRRSAVARPHRGGPEALVAQRQAAERRQQAVVSPSTATSSSPASRRAAGRGPRRRRGATPPRRAARRPAARRRTAWPAGCRADRSPGTHHLPSGGHVPPPPQAAVVARGRRGGGSAPGRCRCRRGRHEIRRGRRLQPGRRVRGHDGECPGRTGSRRAAGGEGQARAPSVRRRLQLAVLRQREVADALPPCADRAATALPRGVVGHRAGAPGVHARDLRPATVPAQEQRRAVRDQPPRRPASRGRASSGRSRPRRPRATATPST